MGAIIEFRDVTKTFGGRRVLDGLSFSVEKGEILAVVGPSGTGKSVMLKHVVGLLEPDAGEISVDHAVRMGYLFQGGALLAWKTVAENVALPLEETTDLSDDEIASRVQAALEAVDLVDAADRYPAEISGGMLKRAGLARVLVREADVILYDEPTSGLDPVTAARIHRLIRDLNRTRGITSVLVTHDLENALRLADRILLLAGGRVAVCAKPDDFIHSQNPAAREFLEAMKGGL